jgi:G6PDH family F420-dependent oxidoreductase
MHPALVAQASATVATLMPGRFTLGVGSGENLNEHIYGDRWPDVAERQSMLEEAVGVIRELWRGERTTHRGRHFTVVDARLYSTPAEPPPIVVAGSGTRAAELAGRIGDGFVGLAPDRSVLEAFDAAGGSGKPRYTEVTVCWAADEGSARKTALEWWPNVATPGELVAELPLPRHFEQDAQRTTEDDVAASIPCGPDPQAHVDAIRPYLEAGYDHVSIHQVGPDQDGFFEFFASEVLPRLGA